MGADDTVVVVNNQPSRGIVGLIERVPGGKQLVGYARKGAAFLDKKLPPIRGRAAGQELLSNLKPGVTVSLVSLPLSISLAIAADASPVQGIITAAWAGLTSALFGGSHYNIVGPTGALSGILSEFSVVYGPGIQPLLAIMAGLISLSVYIMRLERFFVFIPSSVMHGFTLGVAFIIALNQINFAFGLPKLKRHDNFMSNLGESLSNLYRMNWIALLFFAVSYGSLFKLQRKNGKVPWSIVLAAVGIVIGMLQNAILPGTGGGRISTIKSQYGDLQLSLVQGSSVFSDGLDVSFSQWMHIIAGSFSIALVAVLETLISASIADRMTKTLFNQRQEVLSVSLSNLASGITGGIPATAALARTALNIKSGATSRAAGIINAIFIILLSTVFFGFFKYLPLPVVAAILVNVAVRMIEWPEVKLLYKMDKPSFLVAILSGLICIVEDPTMGIIWGALFGMVRLLMNVRSSHTMLRVFHGTQTRFLYLFDSVNVRSAVPKCWSKYTGQAIPTEFTLGGADPNNPAEKVAAVIASKGGVAVSGAMSLLTSVVDKAMVRGDAAADAEEEAAAGRPLEEVVAELDYPVAPSAADVDVPLVAVYSLPAYFTYISAQPHRERVRGIFLDSTFALPGVNTVAFALQETYYADPDALETVGILIDELQRAGKAVYLLGFHTRVRKTVSKAHWFHDMHGKVFPDYGTLLMHLRDKAASSAKPALTDAAPAAFAGTGLAEEHVAAGGEGAAAAAAAPAANPLTSVVPGGDAEWAAATQAYDPLAAPARRK